MDILKISVENKYKSCSESTLKHTVKTDLNSVFIDTWFKHKEQLIHNAKLRTYGRQKKTTLDLKNIFTLSMNQNIEDTPTKLKVALLNLKVQTGRYARTITPLTDRICDRCNKQDVDEVNFLNSFTYSETNKT